MPRSAMTIAVITRAVLAGCKVAMRLFDERVVAVVVTTTDKVRVAIAALVADVWLVDVAGTSVSISVAGWAMIAAIVVVRHCGGVKNR